jgi:hypothetical protein
MAEVQTSQVDVNLRHTTWGHEILCTHRSSRDEQLCMITYAQKNCRRLKVKIQILFYGYSS